MPRDSKSLIMHLNRSKSTARDAEISGLREEIARMKASVEEMSGEVLRAKMRVEEANETVREARKAMPPPPPTDQGKPVHILHGFHAGPPGLQLVLVLVYENESAEHPHRAEFALGGLLTDVIPGQSTTTISVPFPDVPTGLLFHAVLKAMLKDSARHGAEEERAKIAEILGEGGRA